MGIMGKIQGIKSAFRQRQQIVMQKKSERLFDQIEREKEKAQVRYLKEEVNKAKRLHGGMTFGDRLKSAQKSLQEHKSNVEKSKRASGGKNKRASKKTADKIFGKASGKYQW